MSKIIIFFVLIQCIFGFGLDNSVNQNARIVGGHFAPKNQFPYQISLWKENSHNCGGSIISDRWILTAAHCVLYPKDILSVYVGSNRLDQGGEIYEIKRYIIHEEHNFTTNDVALIELEKPLKFSESVQPIQLAHEEVPDNSEITISGWGRIYTDGPPSNILKYNTELQKMKSYLCKAYNHLAYYEGLICLKHPKGDGACNGDSGGPAIFNNELVGVTSFVKGGCGSNFPDGYSKVSYFIDWINEKTGLNL